MPSHPSPWLEQEREIEYPLVDARGQVFERRAARVRVASESLGGGLTLELVYIPGGAFLMGSPRSEGYDEERPQHRVQAAPFWMGVCPVTQDQWRALMPAPRCRSVGPNLPVDRISWAEASQFCRRLAARAGRAYRLPSEAEWEYACRAGSATPFSCGPTLTTDLANYTGQFVYGEAPIGPYRHVSTPADAFPPNAWGLRDMHGNLWEWCADAWRADYTGAPADGRVWGSTQPDAQRVARGGSWHEPPDICRSATRLKVNPAAGDDLIGFRVAVSAS